MSRRDQADYPTEEDQEEDPANTEEGASLHHNVHRNRPEDEEDDDDDHGGFNYKLYIFCFSSVTSFRPSQRVAGSTKKKLNGIRMLKSEFHSLSSCTCTVYISCMYVSMYRIFLHNVVIRIMFVGIFTVVTMHVLVV